MPLLLNNSLRILIVLLTPILIILSSVRLLVTDEYLSFEYGKASFPPDSFGLTKQQRFDLASSNIHYVRAHLPEDALSVQILNGAPVYNPREESHMVDVRAVFQSALWVWRVVLILLITMSFAMWKRGAHRALASALMSGGGLTSGLVVGIALVSIFVWQWWFSVFHLFFFVPGSWLFEYSDTLIRLFPEQFWKGAFLSVAGLSLFGGLMLVLVGWRAKQHLAEQATKKTQAILDLRPINNSTV